MMRLVCINADKSLFIYQKEGKETAMKYYLMEKGEVEEKLETSRESGLSSEVSSRRLSENGKNKLLEGKKKGLFERLLSQIADPMVLVLIGAAVVSAITAFIEKESPTDVFIILSVVILNTVLGVLQDRQRVRGRHVDRHRSRRQRHRGCHRAHGCTGRACAVCCASGQFSRREGAAGRHRRDEGGWHPRRPRRVEPSAGRA